MLAVLVLVGAAAIAVPFLFRSKDIRAKLERFITAKVKDETGLEVRLNIDRALWPPGIVVRGIEVSSTHQGRPFAQVSEARVSLKPFALLSGDVVIDAVEVDGLAADVEIVDGAPANLPLKLKPHPPKTKEGTALDPPFRMVAITGAQVHASIASTKPNDKGEIAEPIGIDLKGIDFDIDVIGKGTFEYELRLRKAAGALHTSHKMVSLPPRVDRYHEPNPKPKPDGHLIHDDDAICGMALQLDFTDYPKSRTVKLQHFELDARVDPDEAKGEAPSCESGAVSPDRVLAVRIDHVDAEIPKELGEPKIATESGGARIRVRVGAVLPARFVTLPEMGGWAQVDLQLATRIDLHDPLAGLLHTTGTGRLEAHDIQVDQAHLGSTASGDLSIKPSLVIGSKKLDVRFADADVRVEDLEIKPLAPKIPLKANVSIKNLTFPGLMREVGVSPAAHVRWDLVDATVKNFGGTLDPLSLDGPLVAKTKGLEIGQRPIERPFPGHLIGIAKKGGQGEAAISAHIQVRRDHLGFEGINAAFGASRIAGRVWLGFDNHLEVDAKSEAIDLSDVTPLAQFAIGGVGKFDLKVRGKPFGDPIGDGTASFENFLFDQFMLGSIDSTKFHFRVPVVEITDLHAHHGESKYDVPSMRIDLGLAGPIVIDALAKSSNFDLEDMYTILKLKNGVKPNGETFHDPRWDDINGHVAFDARAHFVAGGDGDPCGGGKLDIDLVGKALALDLYGERYDGGSADVSINWFDRTAGGLGMDMFVHAATLKKKGGGTIITSGEMLRGGRLNLKATVAGLSLKSLASLPPTQIPIEGTIDAVAEVGGTLDTMKIDADVHMSPLRVGEETLEASHIHAIREPLPLLAPSMSPDSRGCFKGKKPPPFDPARFASDPLQGEYSVTGDFFGKKVHVEDFRITDQKVKVARGKVAIRDLDLGPLSLMRTKKPHEELEEKSATFSTTAPFSGKASMDLVLEKYPINAWWESSGSIKHLTLDVKQGDVGVATAGETPDITFGDKGASLPNTVLNLEFGETTTKMVIGASIDKTKLDPVTKSPALAARIELPALPLSRLEGMFPSRIDRGEGTARATLSIGGTVASPTWSGELAFDKAGFAMKGFAMPLLGVTGTVRFDPKYGIRVACHRVGNPKEECTAGTDNCECMHGEMGGGTVDLSGGAELSGFKLGAVSLRLAARAVHLRQGSDMSGTFDADLRAKWSPGENGAPSAPVKLDGTVDVDSFLYQKAVKVFDVNAFQTAKRTDVEAYDPARDSVSFDIAIRSKSGFTIRNNIVDVTMAIGPGGLQVKGTNQKFGLIGDLYVKKGGLFKFRRHDFAVQESSSLKFDHEDRIDPAIDVLATTDFRRAGGAAGTAAGAEWRIKLHAFGTANDLKLELTSEPSLSQEDVILLLTIGMTRAEANQIGGSVAGGALLDTLAGIAGVDETLKQAIPIDDIKLGTNYSVKTGRTEPQIILGKRIGDALRASVISGFGERRDVIANIEWQISQKLFLQGSYDNVNDVSSASLGNIGLDLRFRLEF